jgi:hypothetical protein
MWAATDSLVRRGFSVGSSVDSHVLPVWKGSKSTFIPLELALVGADPDDPFGDYRVRECSYVPTGILPRGMAINTAVYAGAWWLVLLAPRQIRTLIRRRRCQCITCGYDLAGNTSGVCPECGRPVSPRAGASA